MISLCVLAKSRSCTLKFVKQRLNFSTKSEICLLYAHFIINAIYSKHAIFLYARITFVHVLRFLVFVFKRHEDKKTWVCVAYQHGFSQYRAKQTSPFLSFVITQDTFKKKFEWEVFESKVATTRPHFLLTCTLGHAVRAR